MTATTAVAAGVVSTSATTAVAASVVGTAGTVEAVDTVSTAGTAVTVGVVSTGGTAVAIVSLLVAAIVVASTTAVASIQSSFYDARITIEHLMHTLDFILQPLRRTPLSDCLIQKQILVVDEQSKNTIACYKITMLLIIIGYYYNYYYLISFKLVLYLMHCQQKGGVFNIQRLFTSTIAISSYSISAYLAATL